MQNQEQNAIKRLETPIDVLSEIAHCCDKSPTNRMSFFQLRYFLIDSEPTHDAKVWKCQSELRERARSIEELLDDVEEVKDQISLARYEKEELESSEIPEGYKHPKIRMAERKIRKLKKSTDQLQERISICVEEAVFILTLYKSLLKIGPARAYDDIAAQSDYWNTKLSHDLNMRLLLHKPIEVELAKTIMALNDSCSIKQSLIKIIDQINNHKEGRATRRIDNGQDIES